MKLIPITIFCKFSDSLYLLKIFLFVLDIPLYIEIDFQDSLYYNHFQSDPKSYENDSSKTSTPFMLILSLIKKYKFMGFKLSILNKLLYKICLQKQENPT